MDRCFYADINKDICVSCEDGTLDLRVAVAAKCHNNAAEVK